MSRATVIGKQAVTDETFIRAAYDTLRDAEVVHQVVATVRLLPGPRRGVWTIETALIGRRPLDHQRTIARVTGDYPNSRAATLSAYLFAQANTVMQMAENVRAEEDACARKLA